MLAQLNIITDLNVVNVLIILSGIIVVLPVALICCCYFKPSEKQSVAENFRTNSSMPENEGWV